MNEPSSSAGDRAYAFGPFIVDGPRRLLWRGGQLVQLTPRALDILLLLIEHRGEVVDKDALLSAIWGSTVVEEATVVRHVEVPPPAPVELRQLTFESGIPRQPTWSPDGSQVAFTSDRAGNPDIWVLGLRDAHPVRLTSSPEPDSEPDWSPDGESVVFRSERDGGGLYIVPARGGRERRRISPENISEVEIAVARNRLVVPLTDVSSQIWLLENVDR